MNKKLVDHITLVCPRCRRPDLPDRPEPVLRLDQVKETRGDFIIHGRFVCTNPLCRQHYPIIQGVPCIIRDIAAIDRIEAQVSEFSSPGGLPYPPDDLLATYLDACYGSDCVPPRNFPESLSNSFFQKTLCDAIISHSPQRGMAIDLGCSVGWFVSELAAHHDSVIGLDTRLSHLAVAAALHRGEEIIFQRPLRSLASETVTLGCLPAPNIVFILGDALDPPLQACSMNFVSALNLIDTISHPLILLGQMDALLRSNGKLLISSPFTWDAGICPESQWLEDQKTPPMQMLKELLQGMRIPESGFDYQILMEQQQIPWTLPVLDNKQFLFKTDMILAAKEERLQIPPPPHVLK